MESGLVWAIVTAVGSLLSLALLSFKRKHEREKAREAKLDALQALIEKAIAEGDTITALNRIAELRRM